MAQLGSPGAGGGYATICRAMSATTDARDRPAASRAVAADPEPAGRLPPGPPLHRLLQTAGLMLFGVRFLDACRRRYGDMVTVSTIFDERIVMVFDPGLLRVVFQAPGSRLRAGEANALLRPVLGDRSVLVLDGDEHLRQRRLMLPAFHGARMLAHADTMRACADAEIDSWPVGEPFALLPRMQALTLRVILRIVFGTASGAAEEELAARLRAMVAPLSRPGGIIAMIAILRGVSGRRAARAFAQRRAEVDELLYAEIARRRADASLAEHGDVFSELLTATDERGERMTDREVRDELLTLLLAGHETTATGLAWALDLLLHDQRVRERAAGGADAYLDAVVKEALRIRPVIPGVGRIVREQPFRLGGYELPVGTEIDPSIRVIHGRGDLYRNPRSFSPERFLADDPPDTYTWVPFGGGTRRCLGASFAQMEMRIVLARVLARCALHAADARQARPQFRGIVIAPRGGVRAVQDRSPLPASG
ncbi:MAG: cytochrome P450 [Solirubrobacteraceae bacterium]